MHGEKHKNDKREGNRSNQEADHEQKPAKGFQTRDHIGPEERRPIAEIFEKLRGPLNPGPPEPTKELLYAVHDEDHSHAAPQQQFGIRD